MTPEQFIAKWHGSLLNERAAAQSHFNDLCELLGVDTPTDADPSGRAYRFEKPVSKITEDKGFVDVWKNHCFGWEYKGPRKNLVEAYAQLKQYTDDLQNPPLLIVSDMQEIRIHTNFTDRIVQRHVIQLPDLISNEARQKLRWCFVSPERLEPTATRESVTAEAAASFGKIGALLRQYYRDEDRMVAHFLTKLVFCLFVEDIELLPDRIFADTIDEAVKRPDDFTGMLSDLFRAMANPDSRFGKTAIRWFNGGLFDGDDVLPLSLPVIRDLQSATGLDWSAIDPSIFGVLFESGLDEKKRAQMASLFDISPLFDSSPIVPEPQQRLAFRTAPDKGVGIHYTDAGTIMKLIEPSVLRPLRAEWDAIKAEIAPHLARQDGIQSARQIYFKFRERLGSFRILDPACGSGNFLALALMHLKDFDLSVIREAKSLGLPADNQRIGPELVLGIEINPYAVELAKLTIWITELQWQLRNGFDITRVPILGKLDGIVCRDALIDRDGSEVEWPKADVVIGNPPFLGDRKIVPVLGKPYAKNLRARFKGRVPGGADLVCYWFDKAFEQIIRGKSERAGLVATNSIRGGLNRRALDKISKNGRIYEAWSDEDWVIEGVAVRVSLICFERHSNGLPALLNGHPTDKIHADLTAGINDIAKVRPLPENQKIAFQGIISYGPFDVTGEIARQWLQLPANPNGLRNNDVIKPFWTGRDIAQCREDRWIVAFEDQATEASAAFFEKPFEWVEKHVRPFRAKRENKELNARWWLLWRSRPEMREAIASLDRFIATPLTAKYRLFVWLDGASQADHSLGAIARDDDTTFGILHSRFHEAWSLRLGTSLEDRPRYTPTTTFETFPFPEGLTPNIPANRYVDDARAIAIAKAARELDRLRNAWLNPADIIKIVPEVVPGFPDRILPANPAAEKELKKRTLTNLYNERPTWLANVHRDLDAAVAAAYGWTADISEEDAISRLLELNRQRAEKQTKTGRRRKKPPTPEQLRQEPELPPMRIQGGKRRQPSLDLKEPLLTPTGNNKATRKRSRRA